MCWLVEMSVNGWSVKQRELGWFGLNGRQWVGIVSAGPRWGDCACGDVGLQCWWLVKMWSGETRLWLI